jgi:hypothetical protein
MKRIFGSQQNRIIVYFAVAVLIVVGINFTIGLV